MVLSEAKHELKVNCPHLLHTVKEHFDTFLTYIQTKRLHKITN